MVNNDRVQQVDVQSIKPYWRNPRDNQDALEAMKESIERYGYQELISVDQDGVIVTGHLRFKALKALGHKKIDVIVLDHLTPEQIKEFRLVDNKIAEGSRWDPRRLGEELGRGVDRSTMIKIGFSDFELDDLELRPLPEIELPDRDQDQVIINQPGPEQDQDPGDKLKGAGSSDGLVTIYCPECGHAHYVKKSNLA